MGEQNIPSDETCNDQELTTISLRKCTKERLKPHGQKGQTWDNIVLNLVESVEGTCTNFANDVVLPVYMKNPSGEGEIQVGHVKCNIVAGKPPKVKGELELFEVYKEVLKEGKTFQDPI